MIDSMQNGGLNVPFIVIDQSYFEVVVPSSRDKNVLGIEVRMRDGFHKGNTQEYGIVGHMQVVIGQQLVYVDK